MAMIEEKLAEMGLTLPPAKAAVANYLPYLERHNILFISGQGPVDADGKAIQGQLGATIDIETGQKAAQLAALNILAQVKAACSGDWGRVQACLKLGGFVNSTADFTEQPAVMNGASDLMVALFGALGRHTRFAVSAPSLPFGWAVEIDALFELSNGS